MRVTTTEAARHLRALETALRQELAIGKRIGDVGEALTEAILACDGERIERLQGALTALAEKNEAEERNRAGAASALWSSVRRPGDEPIGTLALIAARLTPIEGRRLLAARAELLAAHTRVESLNRRNRRLLDEGLDYVRFTLETITRLAMKPQGYGRAAAVARIPTFFVDQKA